MKKSNGKFFIIVGLLLIVAGIFLYQYDILLSILGVILGAYNTFKGIRITKGIQSIVYRKQEEYQKKEDEELQSKMDKTDQGK